MNAQIARSVFACPAAPNIWRSLYRQCPHHRRCRAGGNQQRRCDRHQQFMLDHVRRKHMFAQRMDRAYKGERQDGPAGSKLEGLP